MSQLVKSVSIENMTNQREAVAALLRQAHESLLQAASLASAAHLGSLRDLFTPHRYYNADFNFLDMDGAGKAIKALDCAGWQYLMNESGMRTFMDAKAREEWDESLTKGNYPDLTRENITATFQRLHDSRGELFERGVIMCFQRLSWDFKTNQPFLFGKRIIIKSLISVWGPRGIYGHVNHRTADELDDLVRVFCVLDGLPEPDHRRAMYHAISDAESKATREWSGPYFSIRWFKKGTGHLTFTRPDLVDKMNRILAKHYPAALACASK